ncbi:transcription repressor NadR [Beduini massiliensis]|uniref:transcription repressor NadR n=1 Tax=Beduini massiliensis TaxID=1585974 RepID=UPI00059A8EA1|nr:transcription repressor NadR [Beduini massiliensis]
MDKELRQAKVLELIRETKAPLSAGKLGKMLGVSRQLIVGDIALLRASGEKIFATPRGYLLEEVKEEGITAQIACIHTRDEMEEELNIIVDEGGEVVDVLIEHALYGELRGNLHLVTRHDVREFIESCQAQEAPLLSNLSNGVHLHTIRAKDIETLQRIETHLRQSHLLYEKEE